MRDFEGSVLLFAERYLQDGLGDPGVHEATRGGVKPDLLTIAGGVEPDHASAIYRSKVAIY